MLNKRMPVDESRQETITRERHLQAVVVDNWPDTGPDTGPVCPGLERDADVSR